MILQHLSAIATEDKNQINLRFHRGSSDFPNSYFIVCDQNYEKILRSAISYAIFGQNANSIFSQSQMTLADEAGNIWQIKRKLDRFVICKNSQNINMDLKDLFCEISNQTDTKDPAALKQRLSVGRYLLSQHGDQYFVSTFGQNLDANQSQAQEKAELIYRFLNETSEEILAACKLNLDIKTPVNPHEFIQSCTTLHPIYQSFHEASEQLKALSQDKTTEPRETIREIASLQEQLKLMEKVAFVTEELTLASPILDQHKQQLSEIDRRLKENLDFCNLDSLPKNKSSFDWNVPLQCLSYLNVLDKMIPVLQQSLKQFQKHFEASLENAKAENTKLVEIKSALLHQINQCKHTLAGSLPQPSDSSSDKKGVLANLIEHFRETPAITRNPQTWPSEERKIMRFLNAISDTLDQLTMNGLELQNAPIALQEFLTQIVRKRDTLKQHWRSICAELHICDTISLHDFLQYTLKYNELFLLQQKLIEIEDAIKSRSLKFSDLRKLILEWNEKTGSQKVVSLESNQLILSEAQNIIRYRKEKDLKLKGIIEKQVSIEANNHLQRILLGKLDSLTSTWDQQTQQSPLAKLSITDARMQPLFEKALLLSSLYTIQNAHSPLQLLPAFPTGESFDMFCFWKMPFRAGNDSQITNLLNCLKALPKEPLHILFFSDPGFSLALRKVGMGQILPLSSQAVPASVSAQTTATIRPTLSDARSNHENALTLSSPSSARQHAQTSHLPKTPSPAPSNTTASKATGNRGPSASPLSPKVRAVLELLNGSPSKG